MFQAPLIISVLVWVRVGRRGVVVFIGWGKYGCILGAGSETGRP